MEQLIQRIRLRQSVDTTGKAGLVPCDSFAGAWVPVPASPRDAQNRQRCQAVAVAVRQHLGEHALPVCVCPEGHLGFAPDGRSDRRAPSLCDELSPRTKAALGAPNAAPAGFLVAGIAAFDPPDAAWPALASLAARSAADPSFAGWQRETNESDNESESTDPCIAPCKPWSTKEERPARPPRSAMTSPAGPAASW